MWYISPFVCVIFGFFHWHLIVFCIQVFCLLQFNHSVMSDSLQSHGLKHATLPHPSSTPRACSDSHPSSQWCHPTVSSSVIPFSSCLQSFPASKSFPMSNFFTSGGQSIGVSASASVLSMNIQDWFPLRLTFVSLGRFIPRYFILYFAMWLFTYFSF